MAANNQETADLQYAANKRLIRTIGGGYDLRPIVECNRYRDSNALSTRPKHARMNYRPRTSIRAGRERDSIML